MGRRQRANEILNNLPQLQNLIKRDPESYREEFFQQWKHFESSLGIFELKPDEEYKEFGDLIMFLAHVSAYYPKECQGYPETLLGLLRRHYMVLNPNLRKSIVQSVILLRNKRQISSTQLLPVFFTMFRCHDKNLRNTLYKYIVNDVRSANKGQHRDNKLNRVIQNYMFSIINSPDAQTKTSPGAIAAKKSLDVCIELYKRGIWNDSKTVNVIALGCFSSITKIKVTCIQFFLNPISKKKNGDDEDEDDSDSDQDDNGFPKSDTKANLTKIQKVQSFTKKTKSKQRRLEKAQKVHKKSLKEKTTDKGEEDDGDFDDTSKKSDQPHFRVLSLINDPQSFAEKLFLSASSNSNSSKKGGQVVERFEVRLMQLKLVSRVMGYHNLFISSFYPFMQRYLQPHQRDITVILAIFATSCNQFTAPDAVQPQIRVIANNFVSDHCSPEAISAGLNTIRAVCVKQPLAVDEGLLSDLIEYRKHKGKGVMMAARSLLQFYRKNYPEMLPKRERGKSATEAIISGKPIRSTAYGQEKVVDGVDGIDLLDMESSDSEIEISDEDSEEESDDNQVDEASIIALQPKKYSDSSSKGETRAEELSGSEIDEGSDIEDDDGLEYDSDGGYEELGDSDLEQINDSDLEDIGESDLEESGEDDEGDEGDEGEDEDDLINSDKAETDELTKTPTKEKSSNKKGSNLLKNLPKGEDTNGATNTKPLLESKPKALRADMTRILTQEDFEKIDRMKRKQKEKARLEAENSVNSKGGKKRVSEALDAESGDEDGSNQREYYNEADILGAYHSRKRAKSTYEERMASIQAGREGREKFASKKSSRETEGRSTSNKEKRKTKNFKMIAHKQGNVVKGKRSLVQKARELRAHIKKQKMKKH